MKKLNDILQCSVGGQAFVGTWPEIEENTGWHSNAPKIQIRKADGNYGTYYYANDAYDETMNGGEGGLRPGWAYDNGVLELDFAVSLGQGAWFSSPIEDAVLTIAGAVSGTEIAVGGDSAGATILAGGSFPIEFAINAENVTWQCDGRNAFTGTWPDIEENTGWHLLAPKIQIRKTDGNYGTFYYANDAYDETMNGGEGGLRAGWAYDNGVIAGDEASVQVGGGFWINVPADPSVPGRNREIYITVANPLALKD